MSISGFPAFDRTAAASMLLRARLGEQSAQAADGMRSTNYAGLGDDARRAIDLRSELSRRDALSRAAAMGESRAAFTQTTLKRLSDLAGTVANSATSLVGLDPKNAKVIALQAKSALQEVASLLNERFEGEAVFGGAELEATPLPGDIEKSGMFRDIGTALATLGGGNGAALRAQFRNIGASNDDAVSPFSARANAAARGEVPDPRRAVVVEDGVTVAIGMYPNRNAASGASTEPESTGSWSRDLLYGLSVLAQIGDAQAAHPDDLQTVVAGAVKALRAGVGSVDEEAGALGAAEERLAAARTRHGEVAGQVKSQLASIEEVDLADAISQAQATRTQLEASYSSLSMLSRLSLTNYLK
jgi:flagellin-like hook-associated protein FlgL